MGKQQGAINKPASFTELMDYDFEQCMIPDAISEVIHIITSKMEPHKHYQLLQKTDWRIDKHTGADERIVTIFLIDHTGALRATQHREIDVDIDETRRERMGELVYDSLSDYMREFDFDTLVKIEGSDTTEMVSLTRHFIECANSSCVREVEITRKYEKGFGLFYALRDIWDRM